MIEGPVLLHDEDQVLELLGALELGRPVRTPARPVTRVPVTVPEPERPVDPGDAERHHGDQDEPAHGAEPAPVPARSAARPPHARGV